MKCPASHSRLTHELSAADSYDVLTGKTSMHAGLTISARERPMKELSLEEVLRIAGGVPTTSALDELTYAAHGDAFDDHVESKRLQGATRHPAQDE